MGRLKTAGSVTGLRRALFPEGFAGEVMRLILKTWLNFSAHRDVKLEDPITAVFRDAVIDAYVADNRRWFVTLEDPITDPTFGTELGRNDLNFYHRDIPGQRTFLTVECKRLHVTTASGFRHMADKYVEEGLQRFVDGKYSAGLPCGGMLGYVMDKRLPEAFEKIAYEIGARAAVLKMKDKTYFKNPSSVSQKHKYSADTIHDRADGKFEVYHLLVAPNYNTAKK